VVFGILLKGDAHMLKASLLVAFANMVAGFFGKCEGMNWN
jgi:hypothetical protein